MGLPGRNAEQIALRLPEGLRERIKEHAAQNHRSMNSEIISHLERIFSQEKQKGEATA